MIPWYAVIFIDRDLMSAALSKMEQFAGKPLSLPDCASFAVMDQLGLRTAFAFDDDFRDCGYEKVPG